MIFKISIMDLHEFNRKKLNLKLKRENSQISANIQLS